MGLFTMEFARRERSHWEVCVENSSSVQFSYSGERSIVMTVSVSFFACVFVCLSASISPKLHVRSSPIFCACYRRQWLGHPVAAFGYVVYFGFYG